MGQFILETLNQERVNTSQITQQNTFQTPLALKAIQNKNSFPCVFYPHTHASGMAKNENVDAGFIAQSTALLISTMNFFIEHMKQATRRAMIASSEGKTKIILVLDYFPSHLKAAEITTVLQTALPLCDMIVGDEEDFRTMFGVDETQSALEHLRTLTNATLLINSTQGGFVISDEIQTPWHQVTSHAGFKTHRHYHFTAKNAFLSGFLYGWLQKQSLEKSCEFAMACKAIVQSRLDKAADLPSHDELSAYLSDQNKVATQSTETAHFSHMHYASTHTTRQAQLLAFSFGYHQQWQKMAQQFHADESALHKAKILVATGLKNIAANTPFASVVTDDDFSSHLFELFPEHLTFMRPLEAPFEIPLRYKGDPDLTHTLLQWPTHHGAKVSIIYHPDDRYVLRGQQEATAHLLHRACRATGHEFFIEIIPPTGSLTTASSTSHVMQRFYEIGIYPDWWQVVPPRDQRSWDSIHRVISDNDRYCRGVMIAGYQATVEQLPMMFDFANKQKYCQGFVVSKNIFQQPLEKWFAKRIDDQALVEAVTNSYQKAIELWISAKEKAQNIDVAKDKEVTA